VYPNVKSFKLDIMASYWQTEANIPQENK